MKKNAVYSAPKGQSLTPKWHILLPPALLSLFTILFYYPSLPYPFQFDDLANITKRYAIRFYGTSGNELWDFIGSGSRWVGELLLRFNYMWGQFDPWYYRVVNLSIHVVTGIMAFTLIYILCRKKAHSSFWHKNALELASVTMGLFLLHPVQTQAVSYVIQARLEGLVTFFILTGLLCFIKAQEASASFFSKVGLYATLFFAVWLGTGTKEIIITFPFLTLLVDWFFLAGEDFKILKGRLWLHALFLLFVGGIMVGHLHFSFVKEVATLSMTALNNRGNVLTDSVFSIITPFQFLISEFKVVLHYLWIYLWPFGISVEYDWTLVKSFFEPDSIFPFLGLLALFGTTLWGAVTRKASMFAFGMWWFFLVIAPRASIIPSSELLCDYKTYGASFGWLFVLSALVVWGVHKLRTVPYAILFSHSYGLRIAAILVAMVPVGFATVSRNYVWSDAVLFWGDIIKKAPQKARGYNNYAVALGDQGRYAEMVEPLQKAIKLDAFYSDPWSNIAVAYSNLGKDDEAIDALKEAIRIYPHYPEAYNNLGAFYIKKNMFVEAEETLAQALKLRPYYGKAHYNVGRMHFMRGNREAALTSFKAAAAGDLDVPSTYVTIGQLCLEMNRPQEAATALQEAVKRGARDENIVFACANAHMLADKFNEAEKWYQLLIKSNPSDPRYTFNLGEVLFRQGKYAQAIPHFKRITDGPTVISTAFVRLAECYKQQNQQIDAKRYFELAFSTTLPPGVEAHARSQYALLK